MIALKDAIMLLPLAGTIFAGGIGYHKIDARITETSQQVRRHIAVQDEISLLEKKTSLERRVEAAPDDKEAKKELERTDRLLKKNEAIQLELEKERN
jgi:hypothetical protein